MNVLLHGAPILVFILLPVGLIGAADAATTWKTSLSASARAGYDSNVFLQDKNPLSVNANGEPARAGSMVYTASLGLGASWSPSKDFALDLGYSPEITRYDGKYSSEDHTNHTLSAGLNGKQDAWSYDLKGSLLLVDGSKVAPIYGEAGGGPAIGGAPVRDRRAQNIIKSSDKITRAFDQGFIRVVGSYCDQNFLTTQLNTSIPGNAGYANYVDRSEWSAGPEAGWYVKKNFALVAGVRFGEQHQSSYLGNPTQYSNTFTRCLVGVEGKPIETLKLAVMAGPDFRDFSPGTNVPFGNKTTRYVEASATWSPTKTDTITFTDKDYLWLTGSGRGVYQSSVYDLQWKHTLNSQWAVNSGFNVQVGDNGDYLLPVDEHTKTEQNNLIYTGTLGATYTLNIKTKIDFAISREWGQNQVSGIVPAPVGREYTRWQASLGVKYTF